MDEGRKRALGIIAGILVARHLKTTDDLFDSKGSPRNTALTCVRPAAEVKQRLDDGIAAHWAKDASPVYGAVRWYHREEVGANPALAELYAPIIHAYFE